MTDSPKPENNTTSSELKEPDIWESFSAVLAESLFVILPLIVLTIVLLHKGNGIRDLLASPEWSFACAVLMGQTIVKVVYMISSIKGRRYDIETIVLIVAGIMVLGLAPSLIVLSIMLTSETPSTGMIWLQLILFFIGLIVFLVIGMMAHWITAVNRMNEGKY